MNSIISIVMLFAGALCCALTIISFCMGVYLLAVHKAYKEGNL